MEIPYIKKDAIVTISIGAGFIERIAAMLPYFAQGRSEEDIKKMETAFKEQSGLEDWMSHTQTVYLLQRTILDAAKEQDMVIMKPLSEFSLQDNPGSDQSL